MTDVVMLQQLQQPGSRMSQPIQLCGLFLSLVLLATPQTTVAQTVEQLFKQGEAAQEAKRFAEAEQIWQRVIQQQPQNAQAFKHLADAFYDQKKFNQAVTAYRQAIALDGKLIEAYTSLGAVLRDQGRLDEAIATHRQALKLDPKDATAYNNLGVALFDQGKVDESIAAYRQAIALDPKDPVTHTNLADALKQDNQTEAAITAYRKAIEIDPKNDLAYNNLGTLLYEQRKLTEALAAYRKAVEFNPQDAPGYYGIGIVLHDQGKPQEAITYYRKAIERDPVLIHPYRELGIALKELNRRPNDAASYYAWGLSLSAQQRQEAIAHYRKAIALNPSFARAYHSLGTALIYTENGSTNLSDEVIAALRKAVELVPTHRSFYDDLWNRAMTLREFGQADRAVPIYQFLLTVVQNDPDMYVDYGMTLWYGKKPTAAIAAVQKAIALDAENVEAYILLGNIYADQKQLDQAVAAYQQAITLEGEAVGTSLALGGLQEALRQQGKLDQAIEIYRQLVQRYPNQPSLRENLDHLVEEQAMQTELQRQSPKLKQQVKPLLTPSEITQYRQTMQAEIASDLGLAGLDKISLPPLYPSALDAHRAKWRQQDPEVADFLGLWVNDWQMFQPDFSLAIFPSAVKGQVCLIEQQDNGHHDSPVPGETLPATPPARLSTVKISQGQGIGNPLQLSRTLISRSQLDGKKQIEFLGTVNAQKQLQIYAAKSVAELDPALPAEIAQQFKAQQCRMN